jgi:hypothetical protein
MAQPGDTTHRLIKVMDAAGAGVTGLVLGGFTLTSYGRGYGAGAWSTYSASGALVEIGSGLYSLAFTLPTSAGWWRVMLEHTTYTVWPGSWEGEVETQDQDSLYGAVVQPVATLSTSFQLGTTQSADLVAYRYRTLSIPIYDSSGAAYTALATDFPSSSLRISIRSRDQTTTKWDAGPSGVISTGAGTAADFAITTVGNILTVIIPEDSGFFAALTAGLDSVDLYSEIVGDYGGAANKTQPIIRSSTWTILRREVGT